MMNSLDLLMTHIKHCPYPIWMYRIARAEYSNCFVYFSEHNRFPYFDHYIHDELKDVPDLYFMDPVPIDYGTQDWRNVATNEMLKRSSAEWVGSIEQDFFYRDWDWLWEAVQKASETADLIGLLEKDYIHPAFWFMKREALEKTRKDFSAKDGCDHFGLISRDAYAQGLKVVTLNDLGFNSGIAVTADCYHQGGINQNFAQGLARGYGPSQGELFYIYNHWSMKVPINQHPLYIEITRKINEKLKFAYSNTNPETTPWNVFYKV